MMSRVCSCWLRRVELLISSDIYKLLTFFPHLSVNINSLAYQVQVQSASMLLIVKKADVIRTYVSANRHLAIRTYYFAYYTQQMATLDATKTVTDNKSN